MWEKNVRRVEPYVPGEQPKVNNLIKLNTNENPYPPAPAVFDVMAEINPDDFKKYPDPSCSLLVDAVSEAYGIDAKKVFVGVGSDDVLAMAFLTFFNSDKDILFPDITYSFYDVWANLFRIPFKQIPLKDDFSINYEDYLVPNGGIVIANPNAPTGVELDMNYVEEIIARNQDSVVIVDEAYVDFGGTSVLPLIDKYDNLLVVQTCSKSRSLAGIRIGFAFGSEKLIKYLSDAKYSFNSYTMNMPTLKIGAAALADKAYFEEVCNKVINTREWTKTELSKRGFTFGDSKTNFIFAKHESADRDELFAKLREHNILVRKFNAPRIKEYLRISIGTDEEMRRVMEVLDEIL